MADSAEQHQRVTDGRTPTNIAVLTSGGDSAGMNAAVRSVVRSGLSAGLDVFGVYEGLQGLVDGGDRIRSMSSSDVSGILQLGGTILGTARSADFRTRDGLRRAAHHLVERGIDALVVVGGDGSLSGADELRAEWPSLLDELVADGAIDRSQADGHRHLRLVGLVGSIDNDMFGTDMTIGADTALHRITEAVDAIQSTASSHQRTFVIEVMGRHCGYLALMASLATGANFVLIPENPPVGDWEETMCGVLHDGRSIGRRANIVLVAEGACDVDGKPITADHVKAVLEQRLGEDARVTILGHVQRGGSPSAFDRYLGTVLGHAAVRQLLDSPDAEPQVIGIRGQQVTSSPLTESVATTRSIKDVIASGDFDTAMRMRGQSFTGSYELLRTLVRARPRRPAAGQRSLRLGVLHAGGPAPGMNAAVRVAVRVGMNLGHQLLGVEDGFRGLADGKVEELGWMSVSGWVSRPGADLGTGDFDPGIDDLDGIIDQMAAHRLDGLLLIGGWVGYRVAHALSARMGNGSGPPLPIVCLPATISNDLPGTDLSVGTDTALNAITSDVDKIKQSSVASHRCFVVEVMGRDCGYLALMSGLATGAERVYLPEDAISLDRLQRDLEVLRASFELGKRRGLLIRGEGADPVYTTRFIERLFTRESDGLFSVRGAILGHVQVGGSPSPFDRIHATRLAAASIGHLIDQALSDHPTSAMIGVRAGEVVTTPLEEFADLVEVGVQRTRDEAWWMGLRPLADEMATVHAS